MAAKERCLRSRRLSRVHLPSSGGHYVVRTGERPPVLFAVEYSIFDSPLHRYVFIDERVPAREIAILYV